MALDEKQIVKVNALIAKANDPAATPEEAEIYFSKAAALMEKYDLTNEDLRQQTAKMAGTEADAEEITYWSFEVDTKGGHAPARMGALHCVTMAMGAQAFFSTGGGQGYRKETTFTVIGHTSVVDNLKIFLPMMLMRAEVLSEAHAKQAIKEAKEDGTFYSNTGCNARRGFMRGFGSGVANRINSQRDETVNNGSEAFALVLASRADSLRDHMNRYHNNLKAGRTQNYDSGSYVAGRRAGTAYGSPSVGGSRRALNA